jgi:hypothetical protein
MTTFPNAPKLVKGGIVLLDPESGAILRVITLQYNPDTMNRTLQIQPFTGGTGGDPNRSEALRLKGPPVETFKLDAEIDATDQLEIADGVAVRVGVHPQLAALEIIAYPTSAQLLANNARAAGGTLEIAPMQVPLTLFVWSKNRIVPVRVTDISAVEDAFDVDLNPIRAKLSLGFRVLTVDDLGFTPKGGSLYMVYQQQKEALAALYRSGGLGALGLGGIP